MPHTPNSLIRELQQVAPLKLNPHSYQRYHSVTTWWLVHKPDGHGPHHHRAKFTVTPWPDDTLFVGWGVEKGYGPTHTAPDVNSARIMTREWPWHRVLEDLDTGALLPTLDAVRVKSTDPLLLRLKAYQGEIHEQWAWTVLPDGALSLHFAHRDDTHPLLNDLRRVSSFAALLALLPHTPDPDAYDTLWLDLYFGRAYPQDQALSPHAIFEETLQPWVPQL